jgi:hypothetical protein
MMEAGSGAGRPRRRYRTRNWREYDRALVARGNLTVWISPHLAWHGVEGTGWRGRPRIFTDAAVQAVLTLKVLFQLPLRAAQGAAGSLIGLAGLDWRAPHFSTLSRRQKDLTVGGSVNALHGSPCRRSRPRAGPHSHDADILRPSEFEHVVECADGEVLLRACRTSPDRYKPWDGETAASGFSEAGSTLQGPAVLLQRFRGLVNGP